MNFNLTDTDTKDGDSPEKFKMQRNKRTTMESQYFVEGKVFRVEQTQEFPSGFTLRKLVITTEDYYPQYVVLQFQKGDVTMLDDLNEGDRIKATFRLEGRPWENRFFTNLVGENIEILEIHNKNKSLLGSATREESKFNNGNAYDCVDDKVSFEEDQTKEKEIPF